jgi:hypothetical protein
MNPATAAMHEIAPGAGYQSRRHEEPFEREGISIPASLMGWWVDNLLDRRKRAQERSLLPNFSIQVLPVAMLMLERIFIECADD